RELRVVVLVPDAIHLPMMTARRQVLAERAVEVEAYGNRLARLLLEKSQRHPALGGSDRDALAAQLDHGVTHRQPPLGARRILDEDFALRALRLDDHLLALPASVVVVERRARRDDEAEVDADVGLVDLPDRVEANAVGQPQPVASAVCRAA